MKDTTKKTITGLGRVCSAAAAAGVLLAGVAGCSFSFSVGQTASVSKDDVAKTVLSRLQQQGGTVDGNAVNCPGDLQAQTGSTLRCDLTTGGQPVDAVATVTSVDDDNVHYDVTFEANPVPRPVLERVVGEQIRNSGVPVQSISCDGDLAPQVGQTQRCTVSSGQPIPVTVTVTTVDGGRVNFRIDGTQA